jgi:hypothetical protein
MGVIWWRLAGEKHGPIIRRCFLCSSPEGTPMASKIQMSWGQGPPMTLLNTAPHSHLLVLARQNINPVIEIEIQAYVLHDVRRMIEDRVFFDQNMVQRERI